MRTEQTVLEAKRYGAYTCADQANLLQAIEKMVESDISSIIVVDQEGYLQGILTRSDILKAYLDNKNWETLMVSDYMNTDVVTVTPDATLSDVAKILVEHHIHRVVVVEPEDGKLYPVSVVAASDIVYHLSKENQ